LQRPTPKNEPDLIGPHRFYPTTATNPRAALRFLVLVLPLLLTTCDAITAGEYQISYILPSNTRFFGQNGTEMRLFFQILLYRLSRNSDKTETLVPANDTALTIDIPDNGKKVGKSKIKVYDDYGRLLNFDNGKPITSFKPYTDAFGMIEFSARFPFSGTYLFTIDSSIGSTSKKGCVMISDTFALHENVLTTGTGTSGTGCDLSLLDQQVTDTSDASDDTDEEIEEDEDTEAAL